MALTRSVLMDDGIIRRYHVIISISHHINDNTYVEVTSWPSQDDFEQNIWEKSLTQTLTHAYDDSLTFGAAYGWLGTHEKFVEYVDPNEEALSEVLPMLTDEQAQTIPNAFPLWMSGKAYVIGDRVRYLGYLYKCVQAHTSQDDWTPDAAVSLWTKLGGEDIDPDEPQPWVQPTGAHDAYNTGDRVTHNDQIWESLIDGNVWEPGSPGTESLWAVPNE